jgi:hypothetical protein
VGETIRDLRFTEAIYFAVVTGTTTGFGDIHPVPAAWGAMVGVTIQLLASVFYLMIVLATVIQWASQPKRP